jgi:DNA polymerase
MDKNKEFNLIAKKIENCERCSLHLTRNNTVPGEGNLSANIIFVGEGPGAEEDSSGRPFVGRAGKLLDVMIKEWSNLNRNDFYITNIVKCRPPQNRKPNFDEMKACSNFLEAQILLIKPKLIVCLGASSLSYFINENITISQARGRFFDWINGIKIFPTFHPSYLLRNHSMEKGTPRYFSYLDFKAIGAIHKYASNGKNMEEVIKVITERMKTSGGLN